MDNKFIIKLQEDQVNYLHRLNIEMDGKTFLIDRIFSNHAKDTDASVIESIPFKHYMKEFEELHAEYELAKLEFERTIVSPEVMKRTNNEDARYSWEIKNFASLECEVTLL